MARRYFLVFFFLTSSLVTGESPRYELRGQKVNLKPDIPGQPDSILWKRNGNKVVEFNGQEEEVYGQYANRISLDWHTAELNITDLRFEDSGDYELEVYMNKQFSSSLHKLEVIDKVAKPTISCEMNDGGGSNKSGTLLCSVEPRQPQSSMWFEWQSHGNVQPGPQLTISLGDKYDDEVYSCRVSNPLSEETATFTAKDCYPENNSVLIAVLVTVAILLLLLGLGLGTFCKQRHKACFAKGNRPDSENPTHPGETEGEHRPFIDRTPTIPSTQRLIQEHDKDLQDEDETPEKGHVRNKINQFESSFHGPTSPTTSSAGSLRNKAKNKRPVCPPTFPRSESPPHLELNHLAINDKGDADEDQLRKSAETEVPQCENTPELESSTAAEQSVKETAEGDDRPPVDTTPTPPSTQPLDHLGDLDAVKENNTDEREETVSPLPTPRSESPSPLDPRNLAGNDKGDADPDQLNEPAEEEVQHGDSSDSEKENEPKPAAESTNTMSDLESSTASEHQDSEKNTDEHEQTGSPPSSPCNLEKDEEGKSHPANADTPVPKPRSHFTQNSPNMAPEVTTGGQKEDAKLDEVNGETDTSGVGETNESGASSEDEQLSPVSEQKDSEKTRHDQDPNLSQSETHTSEDNQQEMDKPVPAAEKESGSGYNSEEPDLYLDPSHQP
ncbi:uncharacterized protein [Pagrus major]|uniref:uncharacterized protein isoform X1 n=1 Tax=Pagrus major TaxID=143350 RepID=UPI003CC859E0